MMTPGKSYIGCDPGYSGALARIDCFDDGSINAVAIDMPMMEKDGKRCIDMWKLAAAFLSWTSDFSIATAVVERVHSMPGQGVASVFSFGFAAGALQQALASAGLHATLVHPQTWKAVFGLRGGRENKGLSREKAARLYPQFAGLFKRVKDDGRAEAVLLAHYGSMLK